MKKVLVTLCSGILLWAPLSMAADEKKAEQKEKVMSEDMKQAIAFERHKDEAAARQARIEAKHPTVTYSNADRSDTPQTQDNKAPRKDTKK